MAKRETFANRGNTTLDGAIDDNDTTFAVDDGSVLPSDGYFRIRIEDELMIVGARSGDTLSSVIRGAEGTIAAAHSSGVDVSHPLTAESVELAHFPSKLGGTFIHPNAYSIPVPIGPMPWKGKWTAWEVINGRVGTVQFDVWGTDYASYDAGVTHPVDGDSITASDQPKTTAAAKATGTCSGWTVDFDEGDMFWIVCDSGQSVRNSTVLLTAVRTA